MKMQSVSRTLVAAMVAISLAGSNSAWADRKSDQRYSGQAQGGQHDKRASGHRQDGRRDMRASGHRQDSRHDMRASGHRQDSRRDMRGYGSRQDGHHEKQYAAKKHKKHKYKASKGSHRSGYYSGYRGRAYHHDDDNDEQLLIGLLVGGLIGYAINESQDNTYADDSYPQSDTRYQPQTATYGGNVHSNTTCLQEREYQTKVIVGGRTVDAYGTACLQPDGSWSRGPAQTVAF